MTNVFVAMGVLVEATWRSGQLVAFKEINEHAIRSFELSPYLL